MVWRDEVTYMAVYMVFGILWLVSQLNYTNNFIIMTSAATYYFNNRRSET